MRGFIIHISLFCVVGFVLHTLGVYTSVWQFWAILVCLGGVALNAGIK